MAHSEVKLMQKFAAFFIFLVAAYTGAVLFVNAKFPNFHGLAPAMPRNTILVLRTALAAVAIFTFFPIVWGLSRRHAETNGSRWGMYTLLLLGLSETPALYGLLLFFLKGAFKTYFAFLVLSVAYYLLCWPRGRGEKRETG